MRVESKEAQGNVLIQNNVFYKWKWTTQAQHYCEC